MKDWSDVLAAFDKETAIESYADQERFANLFDLWLNWSEVFDARMKKYFIPEANWICTDTRVGLAVYLLDGEMVAVGAQNARKSDEQIQFISTDRAEKVRQFLLQLNALETQDELPILDTNAPLHKSWFGTEI